MLVQSSKDYERIMRRLRRLGFTAVGAAGLVTLLLIVCTVWPIPLRYYALLSGVILWWLVVAGYAFLRTGWEAQHAIDRLRRTTMIDENSRSFDVAYLKARLDEELERANRYGGVTALLCIDVENIDQVNERFGGDAADSVLEEVAGLMAGALRDCDVLGRLRGNEFLAILPETDRREARAVTERLGHVAENYCAALPRGLVDFIRLSIGIAAYPLNGETMEDVVGAARRAAGDARTEGGNRFSVSSDFIRVDEIGQQIIEQVRGHKE